MRAVGLIGLVLYVAACGHGSATGDAGLADIVGGGALAERYREMHDRQSWVDAAELESLAGKADAQAAKEGQQSVRAGLYAMAGSFHEQAYRETKSAESARQAAQYYALAAKEGNADDACRYGAQRAAFEGEVAKDGYITYAEAYREKRRREMRAAYRSDGGIDAGLGMFPGATAAPSASAGAPQACPNVERLLAVFESFRPSPQVLEGIDRELSGEPAKREVPLRVERVEHWSGPEGGRVVVFLTRKPTYRIVDEGDTPLGLSKMVVDIDGAESAPGGRNVPMSGLVDSARIAPASTGTRVTLDLTAPAVRKVFLLVEPYRLIIDVSKKQSPLDHDHRRVSRVVLDPGHGGNDTGATGPSGLHEKDITLALAKRVAPILARQGITVALTRADDRFVDLEERAARANAFGADLFLSIHCNASEGHGRRGVETYILDTTSNEIAQRVAARENATSQAASAELATILTNLRLAEQANLSTRFADLLQRASIASLNEKYPDVIDGGVHPAGFYVLVGARMPAALFETSYISNAMEESRLASPEYQRRLTDGIINAITAYREGR